MSPIVIFHGWCSEEGIMASRPCALIGLFSCVKFHMIVHGPLLCETPIAQGAGKFPVYKEKIKKGRRINHMRATPPNWPQKKHVLNSNCAKCTDFHEENCRPGLSCLYNQALIFLSRLGTSAIYSLLCGGAQRVWKILLQSTHPWGKCENRFHLYRPTPLIRAWAVRAKAKWKAIHSKLLRQSHCSMAGCCYCTGEVKYYL